MRNNIKANADACAEHFIGYSNGDHEVIEQEIVRSKNEPTKTEGQAVSNRLYERYLQEFLDRDAA